jgi:phosphate:Na+ symporter
LVKLSSQALSHNDSKVVSKLLHVIGDFERLGDHALNLAKTAEELHDKGLEFTPAAKQEIAVLTAAIKEIIDLTGRAYVSGDLAVAAQVEPLEQVIDDIIAKIRSNHINRLQGHECTIEMGFILHDLLNNYERISDHCSNVAVVIIEVDHDSFDTHKYLNAVKYGNEEFDETYHTYSQKYSLA